MELRKISGRSAAAFQEPPRLADVAKLRSPAMADAAAEKPVVINGKSYAPLADGQYDAIFCGTGLKECILAGLLACRGWKVLQLDRVRCAFLLLLLWRVKAALSD